MAIPKTFCITLSQTPERQESASMHFGKIKGLDVEFFHGIHAPSFGLKTTKPFHLHDKPDYHISSGMVGCILSHYMLWKHLYHAHIEETLILEDDAVFQPSFKDDFERCYDQLPSDWQWVYVGSLDTANKPKKQILDNVWHIEWPFGTHAYLVRHSALGPLLATQNIAWAPLDIQITRITLPWLRAYTFLPSLVGQMTQEGKWPTSLSV